MLKTATKEKPTTPSADRERLALERDRKLALEEQRRVTINRRDFEDAIKRKPRRLGIKPTVKKTGVHIGLKQ